MNVFDTGGRARLSSKDELAERLSSQRIGEFGAFLLWSSEDYPRLSVHLNGALAYVHYWPHSRHAGFVPVGGTPERCPDMVAFVQPPGPSADDFVMPRESIVSAITANAIACDFFDYVGRSRIVEWREL